MTYQTLLKYMLQWGIAVLLGAITTASISAEQTRGVKDPQAGKPAVTRSAVRYMPPLLDDLPVGEDGSPRDTAGEAAILQALAPDHVGLTTHAQPILYWYARTPVMVRFKIAPLDKDGADPLLEVEAGSIKLAGIQQLNLGDHKISLQPELVYQWSVEQVGDKDSPSAGVIASGLIERMEPGEGLTSRIKMNQGAKLVTVYANEGIWYDALEAISSMIDKSPEDQGLVAIRTSLMEQVGVRAAAGKK